MRRSLINAVLAILTAVALASCSERTPRSDPEGRRGFSNDTPQHPAYERTVKQGESDQMGE